MAGPMKEKFEKYWDQCCLVLDIVVAFDPRFKLDLVEFYYYKIYGHDSTKYVDRVRNAVSDLFVEYGGDLNPSFDNVEKGSSSNRSKNLNMEKDDNLSDFDNWYKVSRASSLRAFQKPELETYLEEPVFPRKENFKILNWWKTNSPRFPILGKMARDILAVPATTVVSESAFSVGGRVIDESRAALLPDIVEALVAASDWLESKKKSELFYV